MVSPIFFTATALANVAIHAASPAFPPLDVAAFLAGYSRRNHEVLCHEVFLEPSYTAEGIQITARMPFSKSIFAVWDADDQAVDLPDGVQNCPLDGPASTDELLAAMFAQLAENETYTHQEALAVLPLLRGALVAPNGTDLATSSILEGLSILEANLRAWVPACGCPE